jgi:hypothetical protein
MDIKLVKENLPKIRLLLLALAHPDETIAKHTIKKYAIKKLSLKYTADS